MKISVVINTYNSERYLEQCLDSVADFDQVVVCDMHSADRTLQIATAYGCKVVMHDHTGIVEPARNYAISQADNDWVLVVDSDEVVPATLREALYQFVESCGNDSGGDDCAGLLIPRSNFFLGRFMHGSWPDYILRLVRKSRTDWPVTIHARARVEGRVERLPPRRALSFTHLDNPTVRERVDKLNLYTEKERAARAGKDYSLCAAWIKGSFRFVRMYFFKGGFRDGRPGYVYARLDAFYKMLTIFKLWEDRLPGGQNQG